MSMIAIVGSIVGGWAMLSVVGSERQVRLNGFAEARAKAVADTHAAKEAAVKTKNKK